MRLVLVNICKAVFRRPKVLLVASIISIAVCLILHAVMFGDYIARAKILITDTTVGGEEADKGKVGDRALRTTAEVLKSRFLMEEVVKELNLEDAFGKAESVNKLLSIVYTKPVRNADIIEISVHLNRPELATQIANTICKVIITDSIKDRFSFEKDILSWLAEQSSGIRKELEDAAQRLREFKRSAGVTDLAAEHDAMLMRIEGLRNNLSLAKTKKQDSDMAYNEIKNYIEAGTDPEEIPYVLNDSEYKKMQIEEEKYLKDRQELLNMYQPGHPSVVEIDQKLAKLKSGMSERANTIINEIRQNYEGSQAKEEELDKIIKQESDEILKLEEQLDKYNSLADVLKEKETAYNAFLKKIEDGFGTGALRIRQIELLEQAYLPKKKEGPPVLLVVIIGLIIGLTVSGAYNSINHGAPTMPVKEGPLPAKEKGMYIERVKEEEPPPDLANGK